MPKLDWVSCKVVLGGDVRNIVYRSEFDPVSVPELDVLAAIHGENAVLDPEYARTTESTPAAEKLRLLSKYSEQDVSNVYPGRNPQMVMTFAGRPEGGDEEEQGASPKKKSRPSTKHTAAKTLSLPESVFEKPAEADSE